MIYFNSHFGVAIPCELELRQVGDGFYSYLKILLKNPSKRISFPRSSANAAIRSSIALSQVCMFRKIDKSGKIDRDESIWLGIFTLGEELHFFLYPTCINLLIQCSLRNNSPFILVDLDKTLFLAREGTPKHFKTDFTVNGRKIKDDKEFKVDIMLRPGVDKFLEFLFELTPNVYIMTAADINYAKKAVIEADKIGWGGNFIMRNRNSNIFSTKTDKVLLKTIDFVNIDPCDWIAIDDNPKAWEDKDKVLAIKPFVPGESDDFARIKELVQSWYDCL